jgi:hypothetical protein
MNSDKYKYLDEYAKVSAKLQSGDIIFRKKDDDVLDKSFSVDNLGYSQVGIVVTSDNNADSYFDDVLNNLNNQANNRTGMDL